VTFVGLAKNTGKTEALTALVRELSSLGRSLAITSIGRDGEESDVIRPRIVKPRIRCPAGTLVGTTAPLMGRCSTAHDVLVETGLRTPLGRVVIARLRDPAHVEVAGPSTSAEIGAVASTMLDLGAEHAIIDGSIDRRAASAPSIADAVVMSTGAVLGREIDEVARRTGRAVELASLAETVDPWLRDRAAQTEGDALLTEGGSVTALPAGFALTADAADISALLPAGDGPIRALTISGILPERLLEALLPVAAKRRLTVVVDNATKVFVQTRSLAWYRQRGVAVEVLRRVNLRAITVNPVAPLSHRLDSARLRTAIAEILPSVPVVDVKSHAYERAARRFLAISHLHASPSTN
jgi:hypothetical protein